MKECLLPDADDFDLARLRGVIDRCGCVVTAVSRSSFTPKSIEQDLRRLLRSDSGATPPLELKLAMSSASALIAYLNLLGDESNFGKFMLRSHDLSEYLRLDNAALRALNLFPDANSGSSSSNKNASLFGLLNHCKTAQGMRMLSQWLKALWEIRCN